MRHFSSSFSVEDKGIQHVSPFSFPWPLGSGFPSAFLSELKTSINHNNHAAVSNERQKIMRWNVDDVANHVRLLGCADQAKIFVEQVKFSAPFACLIISDWVIFILSLSPASCPPLLIYLVRFPFSVYPRSCDSCAPAQLWQKLMNHSYCSSSDDFCLAAHDLLPRRSNCKLFCEK